MLRAITYSYVDIWRPLKHYVSPPTELDHKGKLDDSLNSIGKNTEKLSLFLLRAKYFHLIFSDLERHGEEGPISSLTYMEQEVPVSRSHKPDTCL
jgi:hypothetical protein